MAKFFTILFISVIWILEVSAQKSHITTGYHSGSLIVIGGGRLGDEIMNEFKVLAGGDAAKIVIIPTANVIDDKIDTARVKARFERHGFTDITIMHTSDPAVANTDNFIKPLKDATGIFFSGGRQWRIADGFLNTKAQDEMYKLLDRGGVIAGSSAGATIQGSYLARGDSKNNQIMMGDHEVGLGFITNIAIDQHVLARNRQFDMFDILKKLPHLLGIGIDENTAIVVNAGTFKVIGASLVTIYDNTFWSREGSELKHLPPSNALFYFLRRGDKYDLTKRIVIED
ncbi:MAG: cyanophycinase [Saprospiraceae bacterium]